MRALFGPKVAENVKKMRKMKVRRGHTASWGRLRFAGMKKPLTPYAVWGSENRIRIQGELKASGATADFAAVSKAVGAAWSLLPEDKKAPYVSRYAELKKVYDGARDAYRQYTKDHTKARELADAQRAIFRRNVPKAVAMKVAVKAAMKAKKPKKATAGAAKNREVSQKKHAKVPEVTTPEPRGAASPEDETPAAPTQKYFADPEVATKQKALRASADFSVFKGKAATRTVT